MYNRKTKCLAASYYKMLKKVLYEARNCFLTPRTGDLV